MTSAAAWALPTPAPVVSPGRHDTTGARRPGAGLEVIEGPTRQQRIDRAWASLDARIPAPSQLAGELIIYGMATEGLAWPMLGGDLLTWTLANMGALGALIVGQLAHREHAKKRRIAARTEGKVPAWA